MAPSRLLSTASANLVCYFNNPTVASDEIPPRTSRGRQTNRATGSTTSEDATANGTPRGYYLHPTSKLFKHSPRKHTSLHCRTVGLEGRGKTYMDAIVIPPVP